VTVPVSTLFLLSLFLSINGDLCDASTSDKVKGTGYYADNCASKVREMGLSGTGDGAGVRYDDSYNTINYRLQALLTYLATKKVVLPEKFDPLHFDWSKVSISGHSQGAGQTYYIAKQRKVEHACLLAGTYDKADGVNYNSKYPYADWLLGSSVTATSSAITGLLTTTDTSYSSFYGTDIVALKLPLSSIILSKQAIYHNTAGSVIDGHGGTIADPSIANLRSLACFGH